MKMVTHAFTMPHRGRFQRAQNGLVVRFRKVLGLTKAFSSR
jgi:hypothetical protein